MTNSIWPVVGIGASAGGLAALKTLFKSLPDDSGAAFVVIQHLDPKHESLTAEILTRSTSMPAVQIENSMPVAPNQVYVIPPHAYLTLQENSFVLSEAVLVNGLRMPIDRFLWSLAEQREERGIAVIVSDTGSDGTLGVRAVKGNGGLVLAQTPSTAQYDGMPNSAIADADKTPAIDTDASSLNSILAVLHNRSGHDFRDYKQGTLQRRIARRMGLHRVDEMAGYLDFLRRPDQKGETNQLFKDSLIGVTAFFRARYYRRSSVFQSRPD